MKVASPFAEYIPECKRNMRRLRKKIYKFITSKHYHRKPQPPADLTRILAHAQLPALLQEQLAKRKSADLTPVKNLHVAQRMPLRELAAITLAQERQVARMQQEWLQEKRSKSKVRVICLEGLGESSSRQSLSSTEFEYDEEELEGGSSCFFLDEQGSGVQNLNQDIEFHHFERGNSFLQIESSILSQENLFRFEP